MQIHRFYCESINQPQTVLTGTEAHHIHSVLRLGSGDIVELFDGHGALAKAAVAELSSKQVMLQIKEVITHPASKRPAIIIAASVAKGERFDYLLAKCTELGVDRIIPVIFERTVKQPKNPKIVDRWHNITIAAATLGDSGRDDPYAAHLGAYFYRVVAFYQLDSLYHGH